MDLLLPFPCILVQLHFLLERGAVCQLKAAGGYQVLETLTPVFTASQCWPGSVCHSPHTAPACSQGLQQSRQRAGRLAARMAPSGPGHLS